MQQGNTDKTGCMIVVVGPSGAGKDTVIRESLPEISVLPEVSFVKRVVTRPIDIQREDHFSVSAEQFQENITNGEYVVHWTAHGLHYGVLAETVEQVNNGQILIVNGSRAALPDFRKTYPRCLVIWITASSQVLSERLAARGTESIDNIVARLQRASLMQPDENDVVINNNYSIDKSVDEFVEAVIAMR